MTTIIESPMKVGLAGSEMKTHLMLIVLQNYSVSTTAPWFSIGHGVYLICLDCLPFTACGNLITYSIMNSMH